METSQTVRNAPGEDDFRHTDAEQRRRIHVFLAAMVVVALLFWWFGLPALRRWVTVPDENDYVHRMDTIFYALAVLQFATAGYALWYARRIFASAQSPPPGTWVYKDTLILRGDHARARAWWVAACAVCFILLGGFTALAMPGMLEGQLRASAPLHPHPAIGAPRLRAPPVASPHG
jgi:hypothetical protein